MIIRRGLVLTLFLTFLSAGELSLAGEDQYFYPYAAGKDRDPLLPLVDSRGNLLLYETLEENDSAPPQLFLQGIIYSSQEDAGAVINGEIYKKGDAVCGFKVKKIEKNRVILDKDSEEFILKLEVVYE